jgi:hypothetical protein
MPGQLMGIPEFRITKGDLQAGEENDDRNDRTEDRDQNAQTLPHSGLRDIKLQSNL